MIVRFGERGYRNEMLNKKTARTIILLSVVFITAACTMSDPDAYVFRPGEFNRASKDFGKEPKDIFSVTICYNKMGAKPEIISQLAVEECGKYDKKAIFKEQTLKYCPLFTPIAAVYDCKGDEPEEQKVSNPFYEYPNYGTQAPERIKP